MRIGVIGLGLIGSRMAIKLLTTGHQICVYNRDMVKLDPLPQPEV
jgi:3-hydroxyisobutyrate dehydrogenase-like beta-hydroxyacid dehydrogenase